MHANVLIRWIKFEPSVSKLRQLLEEPTTSGNMHADPLLDFLSFSSLVRRSIVRRRHCQIQVAKLVKTDK